MDAKKEWKGSFEVPAQFVEAVSHAGEAGMGYQIARVTLKDGRSFNVHIMNAQHICLVEGHIKDGLVPFFEEDITKIEVTNKRWWKGALLACRESRKDWWLRVLLQPNPSRMHWSEHQYIQPVTAYLKEKRGSQQAIDRYMITFAIVGALAAAYGAVHHGRSFFEVLLAVPLLGAAFFYSVSHALRGRLVYVTNEELCLEPFVIALARRLIALLVFLSLVPLVIVMLAYPGKPLWPFFLAMILLFLIPTLKPLSLRLAGRSNLSDKATTNLYPVCEPVDRDLLSYWFIFPNSGKKAASRSTRRS